MNAVKTSESSARAGRRPALVIPALSAAVVVAILMLFLSSFGSGTLALSPLIILFAFAFTIALAHTVLMGIPYVLLLWKVERLTFLPMLLGGFIIGSLPAAILFWPDTMVAAKIVALAGAFGAAGATTFHLSCRRLSAQAPAQQ